MNEDMRLCGLTDKDALHRMNWRRATNATSHPSVVDIRRTCKTDDDDDDDDVRGSRIQFAFTSN